MLVGLLADTHDRLPAIRSLLSYMQKRGVGLVLHAGDFCAPFALKPFIELNMPLVGVFALLMLGYLRALPARSRRGFVVAGLLYVGGAAGVEMIGAVLWSEGSLDTVAYILQTVVEEGLEMGSLVLFLRAAHELLQGRTPGNARSATTPAPTSSTACTSR